MKDCKELDILSVTTTVGSRDAARALATEILAHKLAACVQVEEGLTSLYHWKGALHEDPEVRLVIKTAPECAAPLQALFTRSHPYELPQFLAVSMAASPAYADWVRAETSTLAGPSN